MNHQRSYFSLLPYMAIILVILLITGLGINYAATAWSESRPIERNKCFVIDAGHGGVDGGATSCSGILESQFNLEIALRLNDLMHLLGCKTLMIRTDDRSVYTKGETIAAQKVSDLKNRVSTIEKTPNAVLISIHQNHFTDARYNGAQVFYSSNIESKLLAESLQKSFRDILNPGSKRQAKKSENIYLMQHITCPGILVECGFLSNPEEEYKLRTPEYQKQICSVIATNILVFCSSDHTLP